MESELNTIIYVEMELQRRAISVGFPKHQIQCTNNPSVSGGYSHGITIEQLERWIWEKHRELFVMSNAEIVNGKPMYVAFSYGLEIQNAVFHDPFSARLAGVTRVIEELEKGVK